MLEQHHVTAVGGGGGDGWCNSDLPPSKLKSSLEIANDEQKLRLTYQNLERLVTTYRLGKSYWYMHAVQPPPPPPVV